MFGLSTHYLNSYKIRLFPNQFEAIQKHLSLNISFVFRLFLEHFEINERLLEQHRQKNMNAWRLVCSRQTYQNKALSINQLERNVPVVNVGSARTMDR